MKIKNLPVLPSRYTGVNIWVYFLFFPLHMCMHMHAEYKTGVVSGKPETVKGDIWGAYIMK